MANPRKDAEKDNGRQSWMMQKGGFEGLGDRHKASAERSYAAWAEANPQPAAHHGLRDYVAYVQEKQAERGTQPRPGDLAKAPAGDAAGTPAADASKSLAAKFKDHIKSVAAGPKGFASIINEFKYALADIRHKVVEEATYGRAVTPHWREPVSAPQAPGGIHGDVRAPAGDAGPGIHGKTEEPKPDAGGVHGKSAAPEKEAEASGIHGRTPAEPKGLGMSYAELTAVWDKACESNWGAGREREPARQPEQAIER